MSLVFDVYTVGKIIFREARSVIIPNIIRNGAGIFIPIKFVLRKYSDIRSCNFFDANIFGYLFVSTFL